LKVLIVDDQEINRLCLLGLLDSSEYSCLEASNGLEALAAVKAHSDIAAIFMDVVMPEMDGLDATRQIREYLGSNHVPIIFVTASQENELLEQCFAAGGDDFITRPINPRVLLSRLSAHQRLFTLAARLKQKNKALIRHQQDTVREHMVVEHVFDNVIKPAMTKCESINVHLSPLSMFNGDLYLAFRAATGDTYVFLGDFTGHGLSAAIGCMPVADLFYAMAGKGAPVADIAAEANRKLLKILPEHMFCCAVIMQFSAAMDNLNIWVGGMNDIFLVDLNSHKTQLIHSLHMPLGILSNEEFDKATQEYALVPGARVFAYTDGVIEFQNPQGELFGEERLYDAISNSNSSLIESVLAALEDFKQDCEQRDDITLVEIDTAKAPLGVDPIRIKAQERKYSQYLPPVLNPQVSLQIGTDPWQLQVRFCPQNLSQKTLLKDLATQVASSEVYNSDALLSVYLCLQVMLDNVKVNTPENSAIILREYPGSVFAHLELHDKDTPMVAVYLVLMESESSHGGPESRSRNSFVEDFSPCEQLPLACRKVEINSGGSTLRAELMFRKQPVT